MKKKSFYTGVYWGAFDPLTQAHQAIIEAALERVVNDLFIVINNHSYKSYVYSLQERQAYEAIAVVPRGVEAPRLFDSQAFLLEIDPRYRETSSTQIKSGK